jgi:hypothetical protein
MALNLIEILELITPARALAGMVVAATLLFTLSDRRLALLPLLVQYVLIGLLIGTQLYRPIILVRVGLGLAVCLILYVTAAHVQGALAMMNRGPRPWWTTISGWISLPGQASGTTPAPPAESGSSPDHADMGLIFRLLVVLLGGVVAYGLWRAYSWPFIPAEANLIAYWLIVTGLLAALMGGDPLRVGFGLLTFVNGFEVMYLFLEHSFLVIAFLGMVHVIMALGISVCSETYIEAVTSRKKALE